MRHLLRRTKQYSQSATSSWVAVKRWCSKASTSWAWPKRQNSCVGRSLTSKSYCLGESCACEKKSIEATCCRKETCDCARNGAGVVLRCAKAKR